VPPDTLELQVAEPPAVIEVGETEHEPVIGAGGGVVTVRLFEQLTVVDCEPEVIVTLPVFVPTVA
jgi:hypothetical protein